MTDTPMARPTHLRYLPFDLSFTLNEDEDLMCARLLPDKNYSTDIADYEIVDINDGWSEEHEVTLVIIYETLLGVR